jgi:hypothetical protein
MNKRIFFAVIMMTLISWNPGHSQSFWIQLTGNRVILKTFIESIEGESIIVMTNGKRLSVPLEEVRRVSEIREHAISTGAFLGASAGMAAGALAAVVIGSGGEHEWNIATSALYAGILGGIVGSVVGSTEKEGASLDLSGMGVGEKKVRLEDFLANVRTNSGGR